MTEGVEGWPQWRETASQDVQDQVDGLVGTGLSDGERLVGKYGEFFPFAVVWPAGADLPETVMVEGDPGDESPDSAKLLERIWELLAARRDELDGVAVVSDVFVDGTAAVSVDLEHRDGIFFTILHLYRPKRFGRGGKFVGMTGKLSEARLWG